MKSAFQIDRTILLALCVFFAPGFIGWARPEPPIRPAYRPAAQIWDLNRLAQAPLTFPADAWATNGVRALFYESVPGHGKPTRVFAYLGMPKHAPGQKVPGIVLVHGGGGTAFEEWVRLWTSRGYAAIAMDTCGCTAGGTHANRPRHDWGGPPGWGGFDQMDAAREDQWTYHAVAAIVLAHSLLRAQPDVDPARTGITGISWGGYLTCLAAGVDSRFHFAVPVYGCGSYAHTVFGDAIKAMGEDKAARWLAQWEPTLYLANVRTPLLWVTGSNDFAYPLDALQETCQTLPQSPALCVRLRMPHAHGGPGESPKEIQVFADSLVNHGPGLARITGQGRHGAAVWAKFKSPTPITKVELNYTRDSGPWSKRNWETLPAAFASGKATATLPAGVTAYYFNFTDTRDCVTSTSHVSCP